MTTGQTPISEHSGFWVGPAVTPDTYELITELGGGGEGTVWKGVVQLSESGRRYVAIKISSGSGSVEEASQWLRFGHLLQSLEHPGLVRVTDVFVGPRMHRRDSSNTGTARYVVMDYIDGQTLTDWLLNNPTASIATRISALRTVASALDQMHSGQTTELPVAHGDVKPDNIVVRAKGGSVLVDLGLARLTDGTGVSGRTNPYAAPELHYSGARATPEADAFAFAATLAHTLTGQRPPLTSANQMDVEATIRQLQSSPLTRERPALVNQILNVLTVAPAKRPESLTQWLNSITATLSQLTTGIAVDHSMPASDETTMAISEVPSYTDRGGVPTQEIRLSTLRLEPSPPPPPQRKQRRGLIAALVALLVVVIAIGSYVVGSRLTTTGTQTGQAGTTTVTGSPATVTVGTTVLSTATVNAPAAGASLADQKASIQTVTQTETTGSATVTTTAPPVVTTVTSAVTKLATSTVPATYAPTAASRYLTTFPVDDIQGGISYVAWDPHPTVSVAGQSRDFSYSARTCAPHSDTPGTFWFQFKLGGQERTLDTTFALSDDYTSTTSVDWQVLGDGKVLAQGTIKNGATAPIHVGIKGVQVLRFWTRDTYRTTEAGCSGDPLPTGSAVWVDPFVTS